MSAGLKAQKYHEFGIIGRYYLGLGAVGRFDSVVGCPAVGAGYDEVDVAVGVVVLLEVCRHDQRAQLLHRVLVARQILENILQVVTVETARRLSLLLS